MLVAVYGTLRRGLSNSHLLEEATYIGEYETDPIYFMFDLGYFPGIKTNGNTSVIMEVYRINNEILDTLDHLEGYNPNNSNNTFYERVKIDTPYGEAFTYIYKGITDNTTPIEDGDWKKHYKTKKIYSYVK